MRLIRCSHADAAESLYGAGGGGVRHEGEGGGRARQGSLLQLASKVKGRGGGCSDLSYRWVEEGGTSGVPIPGTTVEREGEEGYRGNRLNNELLQSQLQVSCAVLNIHILSQSRKIKYFH